MNAQLTGWRSGRASALAASVALAVVLGTAAVPVAPAMASDDAALLARIEKLEADMQRVEALEKRVADVCAQMDQLMDQITEYSVRQSSAVGKPEEDEDFWSRYWTDKAQECH